MAGYARGCNLTRRSQGNICTFRQTGLPATERSQHLSSVRCLYLHIDRYIQAAAAASEEEHPWPCARSAPDGLPASRSRRPPHPRHPRPVHARMQHTPPPRTQPLIRRSLHAGAMMAQIIRQHGWPRSPCARTPRRGRDMVISAYRSCRGRDPPARGAKPGGRSCWSIRQ